MQNQTKPSKAELLQRIKDLEAENKKLRTMVDKDIIIEINKSVCRISAIAAENEKLFEIMQDKLRNIITTK